MPAGRWSLLNERRHESVDVIALVKRRANRVSQRANRIVQDQQIFRLVLVEGEHEVLMPMQSHTRANRRRKCGGRRMHLYKAQTNHRSCEKVPGVLDRDTVREQPLHPPRTLQMLSTQPPAPSCRGPARA